MKRDLTYGGDFRILILCNKNILLVGDYQTVIEDDRTNWYELE